MVLRSGIILPFQFRDTKKLLMIGVPEENRDLSIWDLKNVVRAAFGIYNFEFRNKKIGFNIPDELLLQYLAQRHDLTNFVIEIGQVFDPCKDNYHTLISNCFSCRCGSTQKQALDLHEPSKNQHNTASGPEHNSHHSHHQQHQSTTHQFSSASNSQHSPDNDEEPPMKLRISNVNLLPSNNMDSTATEHFEVEPKIDYDEVSSPSSLHTQQQQQQSQHHHQPPPPPPQPSTTDGSSVASQQQQAAAAAAAAAALALSSSTSALKLHNNPDTDEETTYMERELQEQELHLERMHEYFLQQQQHLQQQQQHQQQQQQQHQPHIESLLHETTTSNSLRQRKERMSKKQKEVYVNFLEQHSIINEHRRNDPVLNRYWIKLADILNSVPQGAVKHVAEWKQTFDNWRYRVFLYARYNSKITGEEALNPKCFKPLTLTDKRAYNIWIRNPDTAPPDLEHMRNVFMNLEEAQPE
ncbi:putative uncharacterized protein DDB_G0271606 [Musca vetustissima]|uniref:putative uncharacterized protein DDB_G0271606 n=1 Tax=Musca vetustissima TaxID=27455 RepID=UPI002AB5DF5B|nr:putative uncharacterized protein DDB_G0271606 [Musca vetustissima]